MKNSSLGKSFDKTGLSGLFIALLISAEIIFGLLLGLRPEAKYLLLAAVLGLATVVVTFIKPVQGLYLFVAALFVEGLLVVSSGFTGAKLLGLLVFGAWIIHALVIQHRFCLFLSTSGWIAVSFTAWSILSALWAVDASWVLGYLPTLVQAIGLYVLAVNLIDTPAKFRHVLTIIIAASELLALLTIFRFVSGQMVGGRVDVSDITADDPNYLAAYLLPAAGLLMVLFSDAQQMTKKLGCLAGLLILTAGILIAASRGALVAIAMMMFFGLLMDRRLWQVTGPVLLGGGATLSLLPADFLARVLSIFTAVDRGASRLDIWLVGWQMFLKNVFLGVGLGNFRLAFEQYLPETSHLSPHLSFVRQDPHNTLLSVISSLGIIGFILFTLIVGVALKNGFIAARRFKQNCDVTLAPLALGLYLGLLGVFTAGMFIGMEFNKFFWLLLALTEVTRRLASVEPKQSEERPLLWPDAGNPAQALR